MLEWVRGQAQGQMDSLDEKKHESSATGGSIVGTGDEGGLLEGGSEEEIGWEHHRTRAHSEDGRSVSSRGGTNPYESFEAHAYDALLTTVNSLQTQEYNKINKEIQMILRQFKQKGCILSINAQEKMRMLKNQVGVCECVKECSSTPLLLTCYRHIDGL